ncbi:MAG: hypothetical protein L6Q76_10000 [Polyangiaceae bacterium]|nr:hypothetical protein [Polyangiaceae bacterium]
MEALCPSCGQYHEIVRTVEDGHGETRREIYQVSPLTTCERTWISESELLEATARYGLEAVQPDVEGETE